MSGKKIIKLFLFALAASLLFYGYGYYEKSKTVAGLEGKIKMGRYQDALSIIQQLENSLTFRILKKFEKEDPVISYNKGVLYALMENRKKPAQNTERLWKQKTLF